MRFKRPRFWVLTCTGLVLAAFSAHALADDYAMDKHGYSPNIYGTLGLNTMPNARMNESGTVTAGISTLDPYMHAYLGLQLTDWFSITMRQSSEVSELNADPDRLYPGLDLKLRLLKETSHLPEISVGLQSAFGHRQMAGEYIALSKRYKNFDFTGGVGFGRFDSAGHLENPLKATSDHFREDRDLTSEDPNDYNNWFSGEKIGFFAGLEYFTPLKGLSLKADWSADRYVAERREFDFKSPEPWSLGLNYSPNSWSDIGLAMQGTSKVMARLSLKAPLQAWPDQGKQPTDKTRKAPYLKPFRTANTSPVEAETAAQADGILLQNTRKSGKSASAELIIDPHQTLPRQMGEALIHMSNYAGLEIEKLTLLPRRKGLRGPAISFLRKDIEKAVTAHQGSPEETWQNVEIKERKEFQTFPQSRYAEVATGHTTFDVALETDISLAEEDSGVLYRTALVVGGEAPDTLGFFDVGMHVRIDLQDNLDRLTNIRPRSSQPVRSDIDLYAASTLSIDDAYVAYAHSFRSDLHLSLMGGYLEEMYAGFGGEMLYRPHKARFAIGAEAWKAYARSPFTTLDLGFFSRQKTTAHLNFYYDLPQTDLTLKAKIGRFLGEDNGVKLGLFKTFDNGVELDAFATFTDQSDRDLFGGETHQYHGIQLSMPFGGFKYLPENTYWRINAAPLGRDIGQELQKPIDLYKETEIFSYKHVTENWSDILP